MGSVCISMFECRIAGQQVCLWAQFAFRCLINLVDHGDDDDDDDDDDNDDK